MKSVLFIHRSVGSYLLRDGSVRKLLADRKPDFALDDYFQNLDVLTDSKGKKTKSGFTFPGGDTKPEDYARIFTNNVPSEYKPIRDRALKYDAVVIKSCYPNNDIKNDRQLETIKRHYISIASFFKKYTDKQLIILTSPPLTPLMTNPNRARRARQLADWLCGTDLGSNVSVFNFYDLLADPKANWLRRAYRRKLPVDSHPNSRADQEIAPKFINFLSASVNSLK
jgi:hypothetical protein